MKLALYGGSFDPFHKGHLAVVESVLDALELDTLVVMPAGTAPHKPPAQASFASYRFGMTRCAVEHLPKVTVDDWEIRQDAPSYTIDTLTYLSERYQPDTCFLVIGADMLLSFTKWYQYEEILKRAHLCVLDRPGYDESSVETRIDALRRIGATIHRIPMDEVDLSSTQLRAQIRTEPTHDAWASDVPDCVASFIRRHHLYQDDCAFTELPESVIADLRDGERYLMDHMRLKRRIHTLNVVIEAVRLADRFGVDKVQAATAAMYHDVAKEKPLDQQRAWAKAYSDDAYLDAPIAHAAASAHLIEIERGITDPELLHAMSVHSTLSAAPTPLEMVVYLADKIEPSRDFDDLEAIRALAQTDLIRAVLLAIQGQSEALRKDGHALKPETLQAAQYLNARLNLRT